MTYTYIIKSHDLYKIGKAIDVQKRVDSFRCGNPYIELIKVIDGNYEGHLHRYYKEKRVTGEWFSLSQDDIAAIDRVLTAMKPVEDVEKSDTVTEGCKCQKQYMSMMLFLKMSGIIDRKAPIDRTSTYDFELRNGDNLLDRCTSNANTKKIIMLGDIVETEEEVQDVYHKGGYTDQ